MPKMLTTIIPIKAAVKNPRMPERSFFVVQPIVAVAVNTSAVATRALVTIIIPAGVAATIPINGAMVTPVMKAKAANKKRLSGAFWLHILEVKIIINSTAKAANISQGIAVKYSIK